MGAAGVECGAPWLVPEAAVDLVVLVLTFFIGLSCASLLSQAVRTSPSRNWTRNFNAVVIGAAYAIVVRMMLTIDSV